MSQEVWHLCRLLVTCFQQTRTNGVPQFPLLPAEVRRLWCWLEIQSSKIYSRKELADPAFNLLAAHVHPLSAYSGSRWGEGKERVCVSLKGAGMVHIGKLFSYFSMLFSCCLLLALVTPTKVMRIMYIPTWEVFKERLTTHHSSSVKVLYYFWISLVYFSWVSEPCLWEQESGWWASLGACACRHCTTSA